MPHKSHGAAHTYKRPPAFVEREAVLQVPGRTWPFVSPTCASCRVRGARVPRPRHVRSAPAARSHRRGGTTGERRSGLAMCRKRFPACLSFFPKSLSPVPLYPFVRPRTGFTAAECVHLTADGALRCAPTGGNTASLRPQKDRLRDIFAETVDTNLDMGARGRLSLLWCNYTKPLPWQFLNFLPLPQGQGSLRLGIFSRTMGCCTCWRVSRRAASAAALSSISLEPSWAFSLVSL